MTKIMQTIIISSAIRCAETVTGATSSQVEVYSITTVET